jgi:Lrp/AsnC family leucine-responsive transcriptional regulator
VPAVFIIEQFSPMRVVRKIRSSLALKQVRYKTALPLQRMAAPK